MKHTLREAARVLGLLDESYVLERSGVTWNERFYVSGDPDDEGSFGPLDSAAEFATPGEAQRVASRSGFHMTPTERSDLEEGPTGSKGTDPHPPKDGHTSKKPRPTDDPNDPQAAAQAMKAFKEELKSLKKEL